MKYGLVTTNILDLWNEPKFNSERLSQLFFGAAVKIHSERSGHFRITENDEYSGWIDKRFVELVTAAEYKKILNGQNFFVNSNNCKIYHPNKKNNIEPYHLYYGTKVKATKSKDNYYRISIANKKYIVKSSNITSLKKHPKATARSIITEAKRFLGVPYLWGGITTTGFDCSGFVRTIFSKYAILFPRDTKDQIKCGIKIDRSSIKPGDLLFFNRHIGIAIGNNKLIHSSVGGGGVRINSLSPDDQLYREDLDRDFKEGRRIL